MVSCLIALKYCHNDAIAQHTIWKQLISLFQSSIKAAAIMEKCILREITLTCESVKLQNMSSLKYF